MRAVFAMRAEGAAMALLHTEQIMEMGAMGKMGEMGGDGRGWEPWETYKKKTSGRWGRPDVWVCWDVGLITREIWLRLLPARGGC